MNYDTKEKLANEVQKYPFLYDKSDDDYKNRQMKHEINNSVPWIGRLV